MPKIVTYILILLCVGALVFIRFFEEKLFYDPYLNFFKNDYLYTKQPAFNLSKLLGSVSLRYLLNALCSISIIYLFIKKRSTVIFSGIIYTVVYLILIVVFVFLIFRVSPQNYTLLFTVRKFLIHPLLLLMLLPAFYYTKLKRYKTNS